MPTPIWSRFVKLLFGRRRSRSRQSRRLSPGLLLQCLDDRIVPATITWINSLGGDWDTPANWDANQVPTGSDNAVIGISGITVTHTANVTDSVQSLSCSGTLSLSNGSLSIASSSNINQLSLAGGTLAGAGNATLASLNWTGGTMTGTGHTVLPSGATGTIADTNNKGLDRPFDNSGTVADTGTGNFYFDLYNDSPGLWTNLAGATFTDSGNGGIYPYYSDIGNVFNNQGTFTDSGTGETDVAVTFDNSGSLQVDAVYLSLRGGGTDTGTITVPAGADLSFDNSYTIAAATTSGAGLVQMTNGILTLNADSTFQNFTEYGGYLAGTNKLTVTGQFNWTNGGMIGTGHTVLAAGAEGTISSTNNKGLDRPFDNSGTLTDSGTGNLFFDLYNDAPGVWTNLAGATFTDSGTGGIYPYQNNAGNVFNNQGTFTDTGTGETDVAVTFNNSGLLQVDAVYLSLRGGGTDTGTITVAAGADLSFDNSYTINSATTPGEGLVQLTNGTLTLDADSTFQNFTEYGGYLAGTNKLTVTGQFNWTNGGMIGTGHTVLAAGAVGTISTTNNKGLDRPFDNSGALADSGTGTLYFDLYNDAPGVWTNLAGATFTDSGTGGIYPYQNNAGNVFNNQGTFTVTATGTTTVQVTFDNTGSANISAGFLSLTGGGTDSGTFAVASGAGLGFDGGTATLTATSTLGTETGTIEFGNGTTTVNGTFSCAAVAINGGNGGAILNSPISTGTLMMSAGYLAGSANVTIDNSLSWSGGTMTGTGHTVLTAGAVGSIFGTNNKGLDRPFDNSGAVTDSGTGQLYFDLFNDSPGVWTNLSGSSFTASGDGGIYPYQNNAGNVFNDQGTFTDTGTGETDVAVTFNNSGLLQVDAVYLSLRGGGTDTGTITVAAGADLSFDNSYTINSATTPGAGLVQLTNGTLTLDADSTFQNFSEYGGYLNGANKVTVTGQLDWTAGGMVGTGHTVLAAGAVGTISSNNNKGLDRPFDNSGTLTHSGTGNLFFDLYNDAPGVLTNLSGASFTDSGTGGIYAYIGNAGNVFDNQGTFTATATGTTTVQVPFDNTGSANANAGFLSLTGGGTDSGTFAVASVATLGFDGGTTTLTATSVLGTGTGTVEFGNGTTTVNGTFSCTAVAIDGGNGGAIINSPITTGTLTLSNGYLAGSANVTISNSLSWSGGTMTGTGHTVLTAGAMGRIFGTNSKGLDRTFNNAGTFTDSGTGQLFFDSYNDAPGVFTNLAGASFTDSGNGGIYPYQNNAGNVFNNQGTFTDTGTGETDVAVPFNNTGSLQVDAVYLSLRGGGTDTGTILVSSAGDLSFDNSYTIAAATTSGAGVVQITNGTLTIDADCTFQNFIQYGGYLIGSNRLTVTEQLTWSAGVMAGTGHTVLAAGAVGTIVGTNGKGLDRPFDNAGTLIDNGTGNLSFDNNNDFPGVLTNLSGATFTDSSNGGFYPNNNNAGNIINNFGTFNDTGTISSTVQVIFNNSGLVNVTSGYLSLQGGGTDSGTLNAAAAAILSFDGGTHILNSVTGSGAGVIQQTNGTVTIAGDSTFQNFTLAGGYLNGPNTMTISGQFNWTGGVMAGTGHTVLPVGATGAITGTTYKGLDRPLDNAGSLTDSGTGTLYFDYYNDFPGAITNFLHATFTDSGLGSFTQNNIDIGNVFTNQGTFIVSGTGTASFGATFNNSGSLQVNAGILSLSGGGTNNGSFAVVTGATLSFDGTYTLNTATNPATGLIRLTAGSLTIAADSSFSNFTESGGTLSGPNKLTVTSQFIWTGGSMNGSGHTVLAAGAVGTIAGASNKGLDRPFDNAAAIADNGSGTIYFDLNNDSPGIFTNLAGATFTDSGLGGISPYYTDIGNVFTNQGSFIDSGAGATGVSVPFITTGSVQVQSGTLALTSGSFNLGQSGTISSNYTTSLSFTGNLLGSTQQAVQFSPGGTTILSGSGTAGSPQLLEAMSSDLGNIYSGYLNNFAYGTLTVGGNNYVKLVDEAHNSTGAGLEAVYTNIVVVPAGSTLNLNGLHLYARVIQVAGTITGGTIGQIPAGGPIILGVPTPGDILTSGQVDAWTFNGVAGDTITTVLDLGDNAIMPQLQWGEVELLDPSNNVLASASGNVANVLLTLSQVQLPASGTYTILVEAPADHPTSTGNYVLTATDVTTAVTAVSVNGGAGQRSMVTNISVNFNSVVSLAPGAFTLTRQSDGASITDNPAGLNPLVGVTTQIVNGMTVATLTFINMAPSTLVQNGSLADGVWVLTVDHTKVAAETTGYVPMAADYSTPSTGTSAQGRIHRLFGDINGDATIDGTDFSQFANALGSVSSDPNYIAAFDFNNAGAIDATDFTQFSDRFGFTL